MMNRFTEGAQKALQRAHQIMLAKQHTQLDVEHIFLALLQQPNSLPVQIIARLDVDPQTMLSRLESALNDMPAYNSSRTVATNYITLRANRVVQGAAEEADRLNDEFISTEHMLLAIAYERDGASVRILQEADIDHEKIVAILDEVRGDNQVNQPPRWPQVTESRPSKEIINPPTLAKPVGFSHGIAVSGGRMLFLAGQTSVDKEGKIVAPGDVVGQYRQVLSNLKAVVEEAGGEMTDVVKMTIFVSDRDDYLVHLKPLGEVHKSFLGAYYPATALLEISRFFQEGVLIEIEGIAVIEEHI